MRVLSLTRFAKEFVRQNLADVSVADVRNALTAKVHADPGHAAAKRVHSACFRAFVGAPCAFILEASQLVRHVVCLTSRGVRHHSHGCPTLK